MNKEKIEKMAKEFKKEMQRIVDRDNGVDSVSISFGNEPEIVIAEKRMDEK